MKSGDARRTLAKWDRQGRYVFTHGDLRKLFAQDSPKTLLAGLNRLVSDGLLIRAARGLFVLDHARSDDGHTLERLAIAMRRGNHSYVSLESALAEYGVISQIPVDRITVMTTGRSGEYVTPYGAIEFTHTKRSLYDVLARARDVGRPLPLAYADTALEDLSKSRGLIHQIDPEALTDARTAGL
jgi:hypothetical protein